MKEHSKLVKEHFEIKYRDYDNLIRKLIPKYKEMQNLIITSLDFDKNKKIKILDLGMGTGQTTLGILKKFPNAVIKGVDISNNMLEQGKERLKKYSNRVEFINQDMIQLSLREKFDAIVSVLCVHHLSSKQKKELFLKLFNLLTAEGIFIMADIIKFDSEKETEKKEKEWKDFLIKNLKKEKAEFWFKNYQEEDLPDSIGNQIKWLKKAGFKKIKRIFKCMNYSILYAQK